MKAADTPYALAQSAISEIEQNAAIRAGFNSVMIPNASVLLGSDYVEQRYKSELKALLKYKDADSAILYRGLLVQTCSVFEFFCKRTIEGVIEEIASGAKAFDELEPNLVAANFAYTGLFFQTARDDYFNGSARDMFEAMTSSLASCRSGAAKPELNPTAFTRNLGNCTPKQLERRFNELGLVAPFGNDIGGFAQLKSHFGGGGVNEVAKKTRNAVSELIERRNQLVHSPTVSETVLIDEVNQTCSLVGAVVGGIREIIQKSRFVVAKATAT